MLYFSCWLYRLTVRTNPSQGLNRGSIPRRVTQGNVFYVKIRIMQRKAKRALVLIVGIGFIILGIFGLVLPFLQGIIFLAIGVVLVSLCFPEIRLWINKHTERYPHLFSIINKVEIWIAKFIGEV